MVKRGFVRLLTTYNPLFFSYNGIEQRGFAVDIARSFEKHLRKTLGSQARQLIVLPIPVPRDQLIPRLRDGRGDIIAANLTITPARKKLVAFSKPLYPDVSELVVTGPAAPKIESFDDLARTVVHIRRSSSYFEHLSTLNSQRKRSQRREIPVQPADERLEDYDLLEMVNVGVLPAVIVDSHKVTLWAQVFEKIKVHNNLAVNTGGSIGWAVRNDNPNLLKAINRFSRRIRKGTLLGNVLLKRYLGSTKWIDNVNSPEARHRYRETAEIIKRYAKQYVFDWLMIIAQGYQESKLDQKKRSKAGAVGVMQVMPKTAADPVVGIPDIHELEKNIHAGVKYLRFLRKKYYDDPKIPLLDRTLFSFAAYNAGPGNIAKARRHAKRMRLSQNRWFGHVEIAAARTISREPVTYVRNIFKYYVTYKHLEKARTARASTSAKVKTGVP